MSDYDFDLVGGVADLEASEARAQGAKTHWGKFGLTLRRYDKDAPKVSKVGAKGGTYQERQYLTKAQYEAMIARGEGERVKSEYYFTVASTEFGAQFDYGKGLAVKGPDLKRTVMPAVRALMGNPKAEVADVIGWLGQRIGQYIEMDEVPEVDYDGLPKVKCGADGLPVDPSEKVYYAPKPVKFLSRDEARAAHVARWGEGKAGNSMVQASAAYPLPEGYGRDAWDKIVPKVRKMLANGDSAEKVATHYDVPVEFIAALVEADAVSA